MDIPSDLAPGLPYPDPLVLDMCDVRHWFDVGLTDIDTPYWLLPSPAAEVAAPRPVAVIARPAVRTLAA